MANPFSSRSGVREFFTAGCMVLACFGLLLMSSQADAVAPLKAHASSQAQQAVIIDHTSNSLSTTSYYVSTAGDDGNPGTIDLPWRTIQHAVDSVGPGDTIWVRGGTYNEWIGIATSGLSGQPITLRGYPGETAILDGSGLEWRYGIDIGGTDYWTFQDLVVRDYIREGLRGFGFVSWGSSEGIVLQNLEFSLVGTPIKFHEGGDDVLIEDIYGHDYDYAGFDCGPEGPCQDFTLRRVTMIGPGSGNDTAVDGFAVEEGSDILVEDCTADGHAGDGFDFKSDRTTLRRVTSRNNGRNNIKLWGADSSLLDSESYDSGLDNLVLAEGGSYTVSGNTIANRTSYGYLAMLGGYETSIPTTISLHNNIFYNDNPAMGGTTVYYPQGAILTADYNTYYNPYREDDMICARFLDSCFSCDEINDGTWYAASGCGEHSECANPFSSSTPTPTPTTITPTPTRTRTPTMTMTPSRTPTATCTPSPTPTPSDTPTPTATGASTPTATNTATPTNTPTTTATCTPSPTPTATGTNTATPTNTPTATATTPTESPTPTMTLTPTRTPTATPTGEPTPIVWIDPPEQTANIGAGNFTVDLVTANVADVGSFQFTLAFSPGIAHAEGTELGDFLGSTGRNVAPLGPDINNEAGTIVFGAFSFGEQTGASGSGVLATVSFSPQAEGESDLHLQTVQVMNLVPEMIPVELQDGCVTVTLCIPGDLNCDCVVDIVDIMLVASRWHSSVGDDDYDPAYDLNDDGEIDIVDIMLVAIHWGEICETAVDKWSLWTGGTQLRGVNIWQRRVYPELDGPTFLGPGPVGPPYVQSDFDNLAALGANYVNISHPGLFTEIPSYVLDQDIQDNLDSLLTMIEQAGLFAVISARTGPGRSDFTFYWDGAGDWFDESYLNDSMWQDQAAQDAWVAMWAYTAQRYKDNSIVVGYDLMVEPNSNEVGSHALYDALDIWDPEEFYDTYGGTLYDWNQLYPRITTAIRQVDTDTPILIGGNGYSSLDWLPYVEPTGDSRTVYTAHQYEPHKYTHQDASVQDCTYPGTCDVDWDGEPEPFDWAWLESRLSIIDTYTSTHRVPVAVNEFGAVRWTSNVDAFMDDEMALFEQRGMNHALWVWDPAWEPWTEEEDAFNFRHGPDPNNHTDVASSDLMDAIVEHWGQNTIRP